MKNDIKTRNFITQGSILAITGLLCRIIGMLYRIPLIQVIGTVGNGYYTSAYSIYNILLILSSYSLPTAISKVISVRLARERYNDVRKVLRVAFVYATLIGGIMSMVMFFGSVPIARFMEKPFCAYAIQTLAPTIWIMAYLGVLRGYFQGSGNMVPTAISQLLEQVTNAAVSVIMAVLLFDYGTKANLIYSETQYSYAYGAAGGTIGTGAGALIALLFFILMLLLYGRLPEDKTQAAGSPSVRRRRGRKKRASREGESSLRIAKVLILTLLPILLSSTVYNISTVLDDVIFSRMMAGFGLAGSVVFLWGIFGEYRILFNIPVAISNSLSSSLIPSLTNAVADRDRGLVVSKIKISSKFVMLVSMPAAVGLFVLAEPICSLIFPGSDVELLVNVLRVGTPAIVFYSMSTITNGMLQGLGHLSEPLKNSVLSLIVHTASLIALLMLKPDIYMVIIANTIFAAAVCALNSRCMHAHVRFSTDILRTYLLPFAASVLMGMAVGAVYYILGIVLDPGQGAGKAVTILIVIVCIGMALPVYLVLVLALGILSREELKEMPMGMRLYRLLRSLGAME